MLKSQLHLLNGLKKTQSNLEEETLEQALMYLFELGLVSVEYGEDLEARFKLTQAGKEVVEGKTTEEG